MRDALAQVADQVHDAYGLDFPLRAMDEQLTRYPGRGVWRDGGGSWALPAGATAALMAGAEPILLTARWLWGAGGRVGGVLLGGGGAWAVAPALLRAFPTVEIPLTNYLEEYDAPGARSDAEIQDDVRFAQPQLIVARGAAYHAHLGGRIVGEG
jgi:hypothetical protein